MKKQAFRINMNPDRPYQAEELDRMAEHLHNIMESQKPTDAECGYFVTLLYASDLLHRATPKAPLCFAEDEGAFMLQATIHAWMGNAVSGEFTPEAARETARKMLSSYLLLWAWNYYLEKQESENFTMQTHFELGEDPDTGHFGIAVQQIILTDCFDPENTYIFDASEVAADCINSAFPVEFDDEEPDSEDAVPYQPFGIGFSPDYFIRRIMAELYAPIEGRLEEWDAQFQGGDALIRSMQDERGVD